MSMVKLMADCCRRCRCSRYLASVAQMWLSFSSATNEKSFGVSVSSSWFGLRM